MKRQLKNSNKYKTLIAAKTYLNLYMDTLEEFVHKDTGNIYLHESGDVYAQVSIIKNTLKCYVNHIFWEEFSEIFSLQNDGVQSMIIKWIEDTYGLKGINTSYGAALVVPAS